MRVGGSDFGCWANVSSLPLSRNSRGYDGKIEEVGKWFAKQRSSDLQKPENRSKPVAVGRSASKSLKTSHSHNSSEWGKEVVCFRGGGV